MKITMRMSIGFDNFSITNSRSGVTVVSYSENDEINEISCMKGDELIIKYDTDNEDITVCYNFSFDNEDRYVNKKPYEYKYIVDGTEQIFEVTCNVKSNSKINSYIAIFNPIIVKVEK